MFSLLTCVGDFEIAGTSKHVLPPLFISHVYAYYAPNWGLWSMFMPDYWVIILWPWGLLPHIGHFVLSHIPLYVAKRAWAPLGGAPRALNNVSNWFSFLCHLCLTIPWQDWHIFMMKSFLEPTFYDFSLVWFMSNLQIRGMAHWLIFFNQVLSGPRKHGCLCIRISYGNYLHIVLPRQLWFLFRIAETADLVSKNGLFGHSSSTVMISGSHITPSFSYAHGSIPPATIFTKELGMEARSS